MTITRHLSLQDYISVSSFLTVLYTKLYCTTPVLSMYLYTHTVHCTVYTAHISVAWPEEACNFCEVFAQVQVVSPLDS
jgi:hypothetical protein